jgi:hypothetical protein
VPGIGEKTAALLITRWGSVEALLTALDAGDPAIPRAVRAKLQAARPYLAAAPVVVRVAHDAPLPAYDDLLPDAPRRPDVIDSLAERWGVRSPVDRVIAALARAAG